jgi:Ca2+-binding RTX toxin-like protein
MLALGPATAAESEPVPTCHGKPATYVGTSGRDVVRDDKPNKPLGQNPVLVLRGGNDLVELSGSYGNLRHVTICAGPGRDRIKIYEGALAKTYLIDGGAGEDWLGNADSKDFSDVSGMKVIGGGGDDVLRGGNLPDHLIGGGGDDRLEGGNGPDRLVGGAGEDRLLGQGHDDRMLGGRGNDTLIGDSRFYPSGRDTANGGNGIDRCKAEVKRNCER